MPVNTGCLSSSLCSWLIFRSAQWVLALFKNQSSHNGNSIFHLLFFINSTEQHIHLLFIHLTFLRPRCMNTSLCTGSAFQSSKMMVLSTIVSLCIFMKQWLLFCVLIYNHSPVETQTDHLFGYSEPSQLFLLWMLCKTHNN